MGDGEAGCVKPRLRLWWCNDGQGCFCHRVAEDEDNLRRLLCEEGEGPGIHSTASSSFCAWQEVALTEYDIILRRKSYV